MIYQSLIQLVKILLSIFFKRVIVTGKENIPEEGPLIIVANHPNTFMDPVLVASITNQRIGFVGNAGVFSNKIVAAVLRYFHVIPIYRKKDVLPGEKPNNNEAFSKCHQYLSAGNMLLIFPEGSSYYELKLREIKTGTARIALSYEATKNFEGNLRILPIALDYSDSIQFRSMVSVTIGEPIPLHTYKDLYSQNEFECVNVLTQQIRSALAKHIPQTEGKEQENFLIKAHKFYAAYFEPEADLHANPKRSLALRTQLSKALQYIHRHDKDLYHETQTKVQTFFSLLKSENVTTGFFTDDFLTKNPLWVNLGYFLEFFLLLPFYLIGLIVNYIPYILPVKIFKILKLDIEYKTSVQMFAGLVTFPIFYSLELWVFRTYVSNDALYSVLLVLLFIISGYIAMYYWTEVKRFVRVLNFYFFMPSESKSKLVKLRDDILKNIELARNLLINKSQP